MIDKLGQLAEMMSAMKEKKARQPFAKTHFWQFNDVPKQLEHLKRKVDELEKLIPTLNLDVEDEKGVLAHQITKVMYSGFTMMNLIEKNFIYYAEEVQMEYMEKNYYTHEVDEEERQIILESWKAKKNIERLEQLKRKKAGIPDDLDKIIDEFVQNFNGQSPQEFEEGLTKALKEMGMKNFKIQGIQIGKDNVEFETIHAREKDKKDSIKH